MTTEDQIKTVCKQLEEFLLEKNRRYGDSALNPTNIFDKGGTALDKLLCRADDKIMRIKNEKEMSKNNYVDLLGYLVFICIEKGWTDFKDQID